MLENRARLFAKLQAVGHAYRELEARPEQAAVLVWETRNRQIPLFDSAWTTAVETGTLQWMPARERSLLAESYTSQRINSDLVNQEMASWTELAAFPPGDLTEQESKARLRAVRIWQAMPAAWRWPVASMPPGWSGRSAPIWGVGPHCRLARATGLRRTRHCCIGRGE